MSSGRLSICFTNSGLQSLLTGSISTLCWQASAETHKLWAAELAAKAQRRVERLSKKTEWASRLEAAALAEPVVRHFGTSHLLHKLSVLWRLSTVVQDSVPLKITRILRPILGAVLIASALCLAFNQVYGPFSGADLATTSAGCTLVGRSCGIAGAW